MSPKVSKNLGKCILLKWGSPGLFLALWVESHTVTLEVVSAPTSSQHSFGLQGDRDYI